MAEGKRSFVLYADYIEIFEELKDAEAGKLIKHILRYVNDENPTTEERVIKIAFGPIKAQLKRDLQKYEGVKKTRAEIGKEGGKKSGEARRKKKQKEANEPIASKSKQKEANEADNVNDTVTVNDNVTSVSNAHPHAEASDHEKTQTPFPETGGKENPGIPQKGTWPQSNAPVLPMRTPQPVQPSHFDRYKQSSQQVDAAAKYARQLGVIPATDTAEVSRKKIHDLLERFDVEFRMTYINGDYQKYGFRFMDFIKTQAESAAAGGVKMPANVSPPSKYKTVDQLYPTKPRNPTNEPAK